MVLKAFISYSHKDQKLRKELDNHLSNLKRQGVISSWFDGDIVPGIEWRSQIMEHLNTAQIILLLISADFMASDFCYSIEMTQAVARHKANEARVLPIILRPTDWKNAPFTELQALPAEGKPVTSWPTHDIAFENVIQGIRIAIDDLAQKRITTTSLLGPSISSGTFSVREIQWPAWNVPYSRNPFFIGREVILTRLATALKIESTMALTQPQAISGLGGIGKTQVAVEYAYRSRANYNAVLWARADIRENVIADFVAIAGLLKLPEKDEQDQMSVVQAVKQWLNTHEKWLLILDNADELSMVREFLPHLQSGHVLLTTRAQAMGGLAHRIEVDRMEVEVGALFLLRRAGLLALDAPLEQAVIADREAAFEFTREVDGLPLALDQAGAYIEETPSSVHDYLRLYRQQRKALLARRGGLVADHPAAVATTWSLSFKQVEQRNLEAADLLRVCAFLHPDAISEEIIRKGALHLGLKLALLATDDLALNEAISALYAYSLVHRDLSNKTLSLHRLVQAVLKDTMSEQVQRLWVERVTRAIEGAFPEVEFNTWEFCEGLVPHIQVIANELDRLGIDMVEAATLFHNTGWYLNERARYEQAEAFYLRALALREKTLGPEHSDTATTLHFLAHYYEDQGKYEQAEAYHQRELDIREKVFGLEHPQVAQSLHCMAKLYRERGKYEQAETSYQRALAIREKVFGTEHPDTANTLHSLANFYNKRGKYEQAETSYQRALNIQEKTLGSEHPQIASTLHNLAHHYEDQGKYEQAEAYHQRELAIREKVFGSEHPTTAQSLHCLARLYQKQKKYEQAEAFYHRALALREKILGSEHPQTATTLHNLAHHYEEQGKYEQAEACHQRELAIREKVFGPEHPAVAESLHCIAKLYRKQKKYEQAEAFYLHALAIREKVFGSEHPHAATTLHDLAHHYEDQEKYEQAEAYHQRELDIREKVFGSEHPAVAESLHCMAKLYRKQKKYEQAEACCQRALAIREKVFGLEHPIVAATLENYATLLRKMQRIEEAITFEHRAKAITAI